MIFGNDLVAWFFDCHPLGWGRASSSSPSRSTNILQQVSLSTISQTECFNKNNRLIPVTSTMFCAANTSPRLTTDSACHGDSGGPLVCQESNGTWILNGIVSWGSGKCDTSEGYTVFVRVSQYTKWITDKQRRSENLKKKSVITWVEW